MDWGLFDKNAGENTFLREGIVYPQKVRIQPALTLEKAFNILMKLNILMWSMLQVTAGAS